MENSCSIALRPKKKAIDAAAAGSIAHHPKGRQWPRPVCPAPKKRDVANLPPLSAAAPLPRGTSFARFLLRVPCAPRLYPQYSVVGIVSKKLPFCQSGRGIYSLFQNPFDQFPTCRTTVVFSSGTAAFVFTCLFPVSRKKAAA